MRLAPLLASALTLSASAAAAQQQSTYKLIVGTSEGGVAVIDYPSAGRCERARAALANEMQRRTAETNAQREPGTIITNYGWRAYSVCIPG